MRMRRLLSNALQFLPNLLLRRVRKDGQFSPFSRRKILSLVTAVLGIATAMDWLPRQIAEAFPSEAAADFVGWLIAAWSAQKWMERDDEDVPR